MAEVLGGSKLIVVGNGTVATWSRVIAVVDRTYCTRVPAVTPVPLTTSPRLTWLKSPVVVVRFTVVPVVVQLATFATGMGNTGSRTPPAWLTMTTLSMVMGTVFVLPSDPRNMKSL
jgi:hypothetical protein